MISAKLSLMKVCSLVNKKKCSTCRRLLGQVVGTVKIRRGYVGIYVGEEAKRYEVPVKYLLFPPLQELMKQADDDELDIKIDGPIKLACTPEMFECKILKLGNGKFQLQIPRVEPLFEPQLANSHVCTI